MAAEGTPVLQQFRSGPVIWCERATWLKRLPGNCGSDVISDAGWTRWKQFSHVLQVLARGPVAHDSGLFRSDAHQNAEVYAGSVRYSASIPPSLAHRDESKRKTN